MAELAAKQKEQSERQALADALSKAADELEKLRANRFEVPDPFKDSAGSIIRADETEFLTANEYRFISNVVQAIGETKLLVTSGGTSLQLAIEDDSNKERSLRTNRSLDVYEEDQLNLQGKGFKPDSTVTIWTFSDPILLGKVKANMLGVFDSKIELPSTLKAGRHTLQINGIALDGRIYSLTTGVEVLEKLRPVQPEVNNQPNKKSSTLTATTKFRSAKSKLTLKQKRQLSVIKSEVGIDAELTCIGYPSTKTLSKKSKRQALQKAAQICSYLAGRSGALVFARVASDRAIKIRSNKSRILVDVTIEVEN